MATVGGNLLQRPRCWYFRAGHGLLAMKDGKSLVRAGDNRYHAIFMTDGDALFVTPSSLAVALAALDAQATIAGPKGERTVKVEELYQVPKTEKDSELTDRARRGSHEGDDSRGQGEECLVRGPAQASARLAAGPGVGQPGDGRRQRLRRQDRSFTAWPRSPGGAPPPRRRSPASGCRSKPPRAAGEAATEGAAPLSMNGYKVALTKTVVKRALLAAVGNRYWEEA